MNPHPRIAARWAGLLVAAALASTPATGAHADGPALPGRPLPVSGWHDASRGADVGVSSEGDATTLAFPALADDGSYYNCSGHIGAGALRSGDTALLLAVTMAPAGRVRVRLNVMPGAAAGGPGSRHAEFHAFAAEVDVPAQGAPVRIPIDAFALMWAMNGTPALDLNAITGIGLEPAQGRAARITVRWIRVVAERTQPAAPPAARTAPGPATRIAFNSDRSGNLDIWIMDGDGRNLAQLTTDPGFDLWPAITPDGRRIVWMSNRGNGTHFDLFSVAPDGSGLRNLTNTPKVSEGHPTMSPDGRWVAFTSDRDGDMELYRMRLDGTGLQRLTDRPGPDGLPSYAPDGRRLVFAGGEDSNHDIYCLELTPEGPGRLTKLTAHAGLDTMPAWSPDGQWIAFCSDRDGTQGIYRMRPDGGDCTRLSPAETFDAWPDWSPDGRRLVFQSMLDGSFEIVSAAADGSDRDRLVRHSKEDRNPRWGVRCIEPVAAPRTAAQPRTADPNGAAPNGESGGTTLVEATVSGYTTSGAGPNPQRYPFTFTARTALTANELAALARPGEVAAQVMAKLARAFSESEADRVTARGTVTDGGLEASIDVVKVTGSGRGTRTLSIQLAGTATKGALQLQVRATRVRGTWNWGGGVAALTGEASAEVRARVQQNPKASPRHQHKH